MKLVDSNLPDAPYPSDVRARGWKFALDIERIRQSKTWMAAPRELRAHLLRLWMESWTQSPCGSMPADDDEMIALCIEMDPRTFEANRDVLLRGWYRCSDGRLYHPVITESVEMMRDSRRAERDKKARLRAENLSPGTPPGHPRDTPGTPRVSPGCPPTGTGTGTGTGENMQQPTVVGAPYRVPAMRAQAIVDLFHAKLPTLSRVEVVSTRRQRTMRARWREVCTDGKFDEQAALDYFAWFFDRVATSPWLMGKVKGKSGDYFACTLDFLMTPEKFVRVVEGFYHRGGA